MIKSSLYVSIILLIIGFFSCSSKTSEYIFNFSDILLENSDWNVTMPSEMKLDSCETITGNAVPLLIEQKGYGNLELSFKQPLGFVVWRQLVVADIISDLNEAKITISNKTLNFSFT